MQNQKWIVLFLLVFGFFLFVYKVGDRDLWAPDEDEYAQVSREMVQLGHWIFPTVNEKPYVIKPVLYNWLMAAISVPTGDVNEFRARIFSSLAALGAILVIFYLGKLMFSVRAGFLASLILGTSALFLQYARWVQINMLSTLFLTITLFLFYRGYTHPEKRNISYLLMYIPPGLGILNMGPVDLVMPALVIAIYLLAMRDLKHLKKLKLGWGILIVLAISLPYYLVMSLKGNYAFGLLVKTNFIRYFDTWAHKQPFYYYLVTLGGCILPWSIFLPGALYLAFSARSKAERKNLLFLLIWTISIFLFFSLSQCKRSEYILPIYPALALLIAYLGDQAIENWNDRYFQKWTLIPSLIFLCFLGLAAIGLPVFSWIYQRSWFFISLWMGVILGLFTILIFIAWRRKNPLFLFCLPAFLVFTLMVYGVHFVIPRMEEFKSPRLLCQEINAQLKNGGQWAMYHHLPPIYVYYTHRFAKKLENEENLKNFLDQKSLSLVLMRVEDYKKIKDSLGIQTYVLQRNKVGHRDLVLISNQDNVKGMIGESS